MADETIETVNEQWNPEWDMTESEIYIKENGYFSYMLACGYAYLNEGLEFVQSYGWFILIGGIVLYYLYNKYKNQITMPRTPLHRDGRFKFYFRFKNLHINWNLLLKLTKMQN